MDAELKQTLEAMQQTLVALDARVTALEGALADGRGARASGPAAKSPVAAASSPVETTVVSDAHPHRRSDDAIAPEILLAISAAVAAFLGERAHVRQIRLISSQAWGQQGRVNVQASHTLHR